MVERSTRGQKRSWERKRFNQALGGGFTPGQVIGNSEGILGKFVRYSLNEDGRNATVDYHTEGDLNGNYREMPESVRLGMEEYRVFCREVARPVYTLPDYGKDEE